MDVRILRLRTNEVNAIVLATLLLLSISYYSCAIVAEKGEYIRRFPEANSFHYISPLGISTRRIYT
jgi:hypothetical protein